jgi:hypothetical protein
MALTHELDNRDSPLRLWFEHWLPNATPISRDWYATVKSVPVLRPDTDLRIPGTVGTAFDYRLRYYLAASPLETLVAGMGIRLLRVSPRSSSLRGRSHEQLDVNGPSRQGVSAVRNLIADFERGLSSTLIELAPVGRTLDDREEEFLCRYCYALALFEELYRGGLAINSPLFQLGPGDTLTDLLHLAHQIWIDDLRALSRVCVPHLPELAREPLVLNPTFAGSVDVGGADADLIAGGCLVDIKTTIYPKFRRTRVLYQLLGYVFLDYDDSFAVDSVAVYLSRQGLLVRWSLEPLLTTLLDEKEASLVELRESFRMAIIGTKAS